MWGKDSGKNKPTSPTREPEPNPMSKVKGKGQNQGEPTRGHLPIEQSPMYYWLRSAACFLFYSLKICKRTDCFMVVAVCFVWLRERNNGPAVVWE